MTCLFCGNQFNQKHSTQKFCSLICANKNTASVTKEKARRKRLRDCPQCGNTFDPGRGNGRQRFCSHSCAGKFNNVGRKRTPNKCVFCQSDFIKRKVDYCSHKCRQQHEIELWLAGKLDGNRTYTHATFVRRGVEQRDGLVCSLCDIVASRPEVATVLQLDHIDGNWQNNSPSNVRLLCPTCHALTETWGARNMGNGRTWKKNYNQYTPLDTSSGSVLE